MVEYQDILDTTFKALADPTRRHMLMSLKSGAKSVGDLAEPHDMSLAAASKHIRILENAGLLIREVNGRSHQCSLAVGRLAEAENWLHDMASFWTGRLDALESELLAERNEND
jgi:DNA-binding transcriptional ArsR family regulator